MAGSPAAPHLCAVHAERAAVALCVGCGRPICAECSTRFQGVHRCRACIARIPAARAAGAERGAGDGPLAVWLAWLAGAGLLYGWASVLAP